MYFTNFVVLLILFDFNLYILSIVYLSVTCVILIFRMTVVTVSRLILFVFVNSVLIYYAECWPMSLNAESSIR